MGTNFDSIKFYTKAKIFDITCHQINIKAQWSIEKIEKYHAPIRQIYKIIQAEIRGISFKNAML